MIISLSQIEFLASLLNPFICPYGTVQQYPLISLEPAVLSLCLFPLITHSTRSFFSLVVTCRHKCFTFLKEVYKMPVASLAFATTSSFPFLFFFSSQNSLRALSGALVLHRAFNCALLQL